MSDHQPRRPTHDDQPTEQLVRRPPAPLPRPLDPAAGAPAATEVLSLDELMDLASSRGEETTPPRRMPVAPFPVARPAAAGSAPAPTPVAAPVARPAEAAPPRPLDEVRQRVQADAMRILAATNERARAWLRRGDNALIAVTVVVTIMLLAVVAAAG